MNDTDTTQAVDRARFTAARDAGLFGALADPTRLRLLELIAARPGVSQHVLVADRRVGHTTLRHHLDVLRHAGIIARSGRGAEATYRLVQAPLARLSGIIATLVAPAADRGAA